MNVQAAEARQFEQRLGQYLSVGGDDNQVGLKFSERLNKVFMACPFRLEDRKRFASRQDFHGRRLRVQVPAFGPVGLCHDCGDSERRRFQERRQTGASQFSGAKENNAQRRHAEKAKANPGRGKEKTNVTTLKPSAQETAWH